jgi:hypothetical protein
VNGFAKSADARSPESWTRRAGARAERDGARAERDGVP